MSEDQNMQEELPYDPANHEENILPSAHPTEAGLPGSAERRENELEISNKITGKGDMEVHHHSAHGHGGEKKKLKEYFLEFIMIFLAVSLGFFSENIREHYVEHKRANEYALTMVNDLIKDTLELQQIVDRTTMAVAYLDTFIQMSSAATPDKIASGKLYWYGLWGGYIRPFVSNDGTFQQMKSSGSLRYFTNKLISQNIADYDQLIRSMRIVDEIDEPIYLETRKARAKLFSFQYNYKANLVAQASYLSFDQKRIDSFINSNPPLLSTDKSLFNEYVELCRSRQIQKQLENDRDALQVARALIYQLKEEFEIK